jgi:hypothetical protein
MPTLSEVADEVKVVLSTFLGDVSGVMMANALDGRGEMDGIFNAGEEIGVSVTETDVDFVVLGVDNTLVVAATTGSTFSGRVGVAFLILSFLGSKMICSFDSASKIASAFDLGLVGGMRLCDDRCEIMLEREANICPDVADCDINKDG